MEKFVEAFLFEDDLANAEVGPAFAQMIGKDWFIPYQLAFDKMGPDVRVGEGGLL